MDELNMKQPAPVMGSPKPELPAHHVSKSLKVLMLVFAIMLVGGLGYLVWYQNTTSDTTEETTVTTKKTTGSTSTTTTDTTASWKTLTNTKYGYSFKYPTGATLVGTTGQEATVTSTALAGAVKVFPQGVVATTGNEIFSVNLYDFDVSAASIQEHLGTTTSTITSVTVAGKSGFKYINTGDSSTLYFLTNTAGTALEISVKNSNTEATSMLGSLLITP